MVSLTVLMPVYNMARYLKEAIDSVLSQDFGDFRLLVLDDGSFDGSLECIKNMKDPRIILSGSGTNMGLGATLARGLELCDTEFFVRMDADDVIKPTKFSRQRKFLDTHPEVGLVGTQFRYFGSTGKDVHSQTLPLDHAAIVEGLYAKVLTLVHASLMCRTDVIKSAGGYRVRGMGEDWDLFLRVSEVSRLANLPDVLYRWRLHDANARASHLREQQLGIDYACDCAARRAAGQEERTFDEFRETTDRLPLQQRMFNYADIYALAQYRLALTAISNGQTLGGYARLAFAAACSPVRSFNRLRRMSGVTPP